MRIRIALRAALTALGLILLCPAAAHAHGDTVKVVMTGQREGHVTADIAWENDGDAVEEAVAATVNAVSGDGSRTMGPWRLVRDPAKAPAGWVTAESLPPGSWKVAVDVGFPALGHGELQVDVPAVDPAPVTGTPSPSAPRTQTPPPAPASSPEAHAARAEAGSGSAIWWTAAGVTATALIGSAVGILVRRRRERRRGHSGRRPVLR
ncbi:hypothetical protein ACIQWR_21285 [Streptomyces sp. NPDC098789]|uniref:hypothetical protein n=1 Tax=Streptomyces sp. NPDC098789 TaxID=3366098 RepID=UPI00382301B0